jgi:hypothetical protein
LKIFFNGKSKEVLDSLPLFGLFFNFQIGKYESKKIMIIFIDFDCKKYYFMMILNGQSEEKKFFLPNLFL